MTARAGFLAEAATGNNGDFEKQPLSGWMVRVGTGKMESADGQGWTQIIGAEAGALWNLESAFPADLPKFFGLDLRSLESICGFPCRFAWLHNRGSPRRSAWSVAGVMTEPV